MLATDDHLSEKRRRQNRESQRRYREKHRKEQAKQALDGARQQAPLASSMSQRDSAPDHSSFTSTQSAVMVHDLTQIETEGGSDTAAVEDGFQNMNFFSDHGNPDTTASTTTTQDTRPQFSVHQCTCSTSGSSVTTVPTPESILASIPLSTLDPKENNTSASSILYYPEKEPDYFPQYSFQFDGNDFNSPPPAAGVQQSENLSGLGVLSGRSSSNEHATVNKTPNTTVSRPATRPQAASLQRDGAVTTTATARTISIAAISPLPRDSRISPSGVPITSQTRQGHRQQQHHHRHRHEHNHGWMTPQDTPQSMVAVAESDVATTILPTTSEVTSSPLIPPSTASKKKRPLELERTARTGPFQTHYNKPISPAPTARQTQEYRGKHAHLHGKHTSIITTTQPPKKIKSHHQQTQEDPTPPPSAKGEPDSKAEKLINQVEDLYSFGVTMGILPEDRDLLVSLGRMKARFRSLHVSSFATVTPTPPLSESTLGSREASTSSTASGGRRDLDLPTGGGSGSGGGMYADFGRRKEEKQVDMEDFLVDVNVDMDVGVGGDDDVYYYDDVCG